MNKENEDRASRLHKEALIIDALQSGQAFSGDVGVGPFEKEVEAGLTAANLTVIETYDTPWEGLKRLKPWYDLLEQHSDKVILVATARDIERAKREGKFAIIMNAQNGTILENDVNLLSVYKKLGLKIIQLTYFEQNLLGEGCWERTNGGLTNFGIEVVEEMNRLGLIIDLAHSGDQVTMDAIKYSKSPVLITHSNARCMVDHIRNKTDEQIKALANKGGVIGVNAWSAYCEVRKGVRPTVEDLLDIVDYIVKLVGPDYVGLGLDICPLFVTREQYNSWVKAYPAWLPKGGYGDYGARTIFTNEDGQDDMSRLSEITMGLVARGYSDQDIEKILGLNFLKVFKDVWGE